MSTVAEEMWKSEYKKYFVISMSGADGKAGRIKS